MVNGQGPFRFVVDTGANRSVLSQRLADSLGLIPIGMNDVHTIDSVQLAPMVRVDSISYGSVEVNDQSVPILDGPMLGGEQGLLGVDGMGGKRLRLDFDQRCIEIIPAHTAPVLRGWVHLRGKLRFGHLVVVPGHVGDTRVNVLIDTGSDVSLANTAFRTVMQRVWFDRETQNLIVAYTTGRPIQLNNAIILPELGLGDVAITNMTLFTGDFHVFHVWGMTDEPTILVGMDVLSRTHAISIDYERATVYLRLPHTF